MSKHQHIIQSPNDQHQYRYLILDNSLRVLLVHDANASQGAASMAVNVGHFDDPISRPGMAHFLEHMLFLGTQKYPDPADYHHFINQHGGTNNAWTGTEHTNYFYNIAADQFAASLDRFSQFFIAPLFNQELLERERLAIESEFSMKLKDDVRRQYQAHKETANPAHPFSKFSVGNLTTLAGEPKALRTELLEFYRKNYSANLMTLCLVAPQSLDELEKLAKRYFTDITDLQLKKNYPDTPLYLPEQLQSQIHIIPLKDQKRLTLSFSLPSLKPFYKHKPLTFVSHLLGYEGKNSLFSYLKQRGLANSLSAGGGVSGYNFKDYNIGISLTDKGIEQIPAVINSVFDYINLISREGLEDWRYKERAQLLQTAFRFQEASKPLDLASHLSINMHHYDVEDIIFGDYRMDGLIKTEIQSLLSMMTVSNMRVQITAQELITKQQAAWYHTPYLIMPFVCDVEQKKLSAHAELSLPNPNIFICDNHEIRTQTPSSTVPQIIAQGNAYRLWHRKDDVFNVPKGLMFLSIDSAQAAATPRHAALTRLYVEMLLDYLTEHTYDAEVAGLSYNLYPHQGGITLRISGFTAKQDSLLSLIIEKAQERNFEQSRFDLIKNQILKSWRNQSQAKPLTQLFSHLTATLQKRSFEAAKMANSLESIELDDLHAHVQAFYKHVYLEGLVYGDWLDSEAITLGTQLENKLTQLSTPSQESSRELINIADQGTLIREIPIAHQDSSIIVYYQSTQSSPDEMALYSLLNHTMSSSFFHELRTKKQLGYMVGTGYLPLNRYPGMIFYIQSPSYGPLKLLEAIDEFIADFAYAVMQITNQQWENTKSGLTQQIMTLDTNLKNQGQRYWACIGNHDYQFNQREHIVNHINNLTRSDLIKFIMQKMRTKHADRLVLFNSAQQHKHQTEIAAHNQIHDLQAFKQHAPHFMT